MRDDELLAEAVDEAMSPVVDELWAPIREQLRAMRAELDLAPSTLDVEDLVARVRARATGRS